MPIGKEHAPLAIAGLSLVALPFALDLAGLPLRSAIDVLVFAIACVAASAVLSGALILRRRGVYFSLLTLALTALLFAISYRWTELTGGESGLGGVTRSRVFGIDLEYDRTYYSLVAAVGLAVCYLLWRFHHSPVGSVL